MIKTIYFLFFIVAFSLGLWACTGRKPDKFKTLTPDQFETLLQDNTIQLVDVRTLAEYTEGHLPGSLHICVTCDDFAGQADEILSKEQPVAVYCKSGRRSRTAARLLTEKGYRVYNLDTGIQGWQELGKEVVQ